MNLMKQFLMVAKGRKENYLHTILEIKAREISCIEKASEDLKDGGKVNKHRHK